MPQNVFVTGPALIYVGFPTAINVNPPPPVTPGTAGPGNTIAAANVQVFANFSYHFLGTCESSPEIQDRGFFEPVFNSLSGVRIPWDEVYQGEDAIIGLTLTRYDELVYRAVRTRISSPAFAGQTLWGEIGTLVYTERRRMHLVITYTYSIKPQMQQAGLPAGVTYVNTRLIGPDSRGPLNTTARKPYLVFHALPITIPGVGSVLYVDSIPANLPLAD